MMKKRFKNMLLKSKTKNGLFILVCAVSITVFPGIMTGCAGKEPSLSETQKNNEFSGSQTDNHETSNEEPVAGEKEQTIPTQTPASEQPEAASDNTNDSEETLSEDGREIKGIAENFAAAYFSGDTDTIQSYLTSPYEWDIEVYEGLDTTGAGTISELTLKGLTNIGQEESGSIQVISLEFKDSHFEDMFIYLTIEFVKQEDGWKIQFYGLEG